MRVYNIRPDRVGLPFEKLTFALSIETVPSSTALSNGHGFSNTGRISRSNFVPTRLKAAGVAVDEDGVEAKSFPSTIVNEEEK